MPGSMPSGQNVRGRDDETSRLRANIVNARRVAAGPILSGIGRAAWQFTGGATPQIGLQVRPLWSTAIGLALLQSPLLLGRINQPEVVDAGIHLGAGAGLHEIGDSNRGQQTNDCDYNHYFNEGKA